MVIPSDSIQPSNKSISEQTRTLFEELEHVANKAGELISRLYASLREDGFAPKTARRMIEARLEVNQRTIRRALPEEAKNQNKVRERFADKLTASNARLVVDEQPSIPAPDQPIIEPEPTREELIEIAEFNQQVREQVQVQRRHEEAYIPLPLAEQLNKFLLARLIGMAKANGDNSITIKINSEGDVYLP